jgi:ADP-heptose:LPS heptosyltransferase
LSFLLNQTSSKAHEGTTPQRILLVRLSHLGDVIHALPVYRAVREAYPAAEIAWVVQAEFAAVLEDLSGLSRVFHFGRNNGFAAWPRLRDQLLEWGPNWVIDMQGNTKSAMVSLASSATRRSGLAHADWTERFAAQSFTDHAAPAEGRHAIQRMLALARHVAPGVTPDSSFEVCEQRRSEGLDEWRQRLPQGRGQAWIIMLAARDDVRSWPSAHFANLARQLHARGGRVIVLSGPQEAEVGREIEHELAGEDRQDRPIAHWVGQRGLPALSAFFCAAADAGAHMIACDTGPTHLAAACGLSVHLLAGPQDALRTGPWPLALELPLPHTQEPKDSPHRVLRHPAPPDCAPCLARSCDHPRGPICMSELSPTRVADLCHGAALAEPKRELD